MLEKSAGLLVQENSRFPFFVYDEYGIDSVENEMILHTMKYTNRCKFNDFRPNIP